MHTNGDLTILSVGGTSVLANLKDVTWRTTPEHNETKNLKQFGKSRQLSKLGAELEVSLYSTTSGLRVDWFNVTSLTVGGVDVRCDMYEFDIEGTFEQKMDPAFCSKYKYPMNFGKDYSARIVFGVADTGYQTLIAAANSVAEVDRSLVLNVVINGVTITIPMTIGAIEQAFPDGDNQKVTLNLLGNAPIDGSAYPTAPTGTAGLLNWCFNDSKSPMAFIFKTHATNGQNYNGNLIPSRFKFGARDGEVIVNEYSLVTRGPFNPA